MLYYGIMTVRNLSYLRMASQIVQLCSALHILAKIIKDMTRWIYRSYLLPPEEIIAPQMKIIHAFVLTILQPEGSQVIKVHVHQIKLVRKACCTNSGHRLKLRVSVLFHFAFVTVPSIFCERQRPSKAANSCFVPALFGHAVDGDFILPHHSDCIFEAFVILVNPNEKIIAVSGP
ncbi:hypothetical protein QYF36_025666 [Acer negundo]|nr:hypothetical protein QYF36_025666 [Acer negundo]